MSSIKPYFLVNLRPRTTNQNKNSLMLAKCRYVEIQVNQQWISCHIFGLIEDFMDLFCVLVAVQISTNSFQIKVILEKTCGGRFLWNRNWDLGWIWAGWHYWRKNIWADYEQFLGLVFLSFCGQKKIKNIVASALKSWIKWSYSFSLKI